MQENGAQDRRDHRACKTNCRSLSQGHDEDRQKETDGCHRHGKSAQDLNFGHGQSKSLPAFLEVQQRPQAQRTDRIAQRRHGSIGPCTGNRFDDRIAQ